MLSKTIIERNRICAICENSGDIQPSATFHGVVIGVHGSYAIYPNAEIVCCGKVNDNELLFRTENGRYYFSIRDGWGEENGRLYGLSPGFVHDFQHPTTADTILAECDTYNGPSPTSWSGALVYHYTKRTLAVIRAVMEKV